MSREMTYRHVGRSGLLVSPIGLGTMGFGYLTDEPTSLAVLEAALEAGINLVDTADVYGGPQTPDMAQGYGRCEEIIGRWLARTGRRDDIVLATKVYQPMGLGPNDCRLSAYHLRRACEASLRRLQTDHIDLYQMHHVDRATPWEEIFQAIEQLVQQGKISYVGSINFAGWDIATAQAVASARHFVGLTSEQSLYNLAVRAIEQEVIPALRHLGIGLIAYSPLHAGMLTGIVSNAASAPGDKRTSQACVTSCTPTRRCALSSAPNRPRWRWPGCSATRSPPPQSSAPQTSTSSTQTSPPSPPTWNQKRCKLSTRSSPDQGKLPSPTPGNAPRRASLHAIPAAGINPKRGGLAASRRTSVRDEVVGSEASRPAGHATFRRRCEWRTVEDVGSALLDELGELGEKPATHDQTLSNGELRDRAQVKRLSLLGGAPSVQLKGGSAAGLGEVGYAVVWGVTVRGTVLTLGLASGPPQRAELPGTTTVTMGAARSTACQRPGTCRSHGDPTVQ